MTDFSGTIQPNEDPLEYRRDETAVDRELSRLRIDTSNQIAELSHQVRELRRSVAMLTALSWATLLLLLVAGAGCAFAVWGLAG